MGERRPFVVVGAGIGGLTAALALAQRGFMVIVVERSGELSEIGAGIQLAPNAGRALAALGLDKAVAAAAIEPASIDVVNGRSGQLLASIPAATFRDRYGFPYRVIHRADLQSILVAAAARIRIRTELAATVDSFITDPAGLLVRIRKPSGSNVVRAEAVIAADGVWSAFRERIPGSAKTQATGRTAWRAIVPADVAREIMPLDRIVLSLGARAHLVHYPVAQGAAVNVVAIVEETLDRKGWSAAGDPEALLAKFSGWSIATRRILEAPVAWQKFAVAAVDPARAWQHERLLLLGDAAHAMPPFLAQGAAMAIEDGLVLADVLAANNDTPAALAAYVQARQPRVSAVTGQSQQAGERFHMRGVMGVARNLALRLAGERLILRDSDAIYRWRPPENAEAPAVAS